MTQDNTPPGPTFKARLLHINKGVGPEQGVVGKISPTAFRECVVWYWNRALKIRRGGVLSCVTYGRMSSCGWMLSRAVRPRMCVSVRSCMWSGPSLSAVGPLELFGGDSFTRKEGLFIGHAPVKHTCRTPRVVR